MKVEFVKAYEVDDLSGTKYEAGQIVDLDERSAKHFFNRDVAKPYVVKKPKKKKANG